MKVSIFETLDLKDPENGTRAPQNSFEFGLPAPKLPQKREIKKFNSQRKFSRDLK